MRVWLLTLDTEPIERLAYFTEESAIAAYRSAKLQAIGSWGTPSLMVGEMYKVDPDA